MKKWILVIALVVLGMIAYRTHDNSILVQVITVKKGNISEYIEEQGKTTLPHIHKIAMPILGSINEIKLQEGDFVKKDDIVVTIDNADIRTKLEQAQARLGGILSRIELNKYNEIEKTALLDAKKIILSMDKVVKSSQKKMQSSKVQQEFALWLFEQQEKLYASKNTSLEQLNNAKTRLIETNVNHESGQLNLNALKTVFSATKLLPIAIKQYIKRKEFKHKILLHDKKIAEVALVEAKRNLDKTKICTLINGVVLKKYFSNKRILSAGNPLMDIGDFNKLQITVNVLSREVVKIKQGNKVDIHIGVENAILDGKVLRIKPQGITKISSLGIEQQRVGVVIELKRKDIISWQKKYQLGLNYYVQAKIYIASKTKILKIPRISMFKDDNGEYNVFCIKNGHIRKTLIKVGLLNDLEAEITSGLNENDTVVTAPESSLIDGTKVRFYLE